MNQPIRALLAAVLICELIASQLIPGPLAPEMQAYRVLHLLQMAALIVLALRGFGLDTPVSRLVLAGMVLSLMGDLINSFLVDLSHVLNPQTLLSIPWFVAAHLCYVTAFVLLMRDPVLQQPGVEAPNWRPVVLVWPVLALGLWWLLMDQAAPPLLLKLALGYALVVTLMGLVAILLGRQLGRVAWLPALGGLLFVLSDSIIGSFLLDGPARPLWASQAIWLSYFAAQACICHAAGLAGAARQRR